MKLPFHQIFGLLAPIHAILAAILPDFIQQDLKDPEVHAALVGAADTALTSQYPWAKLIPEETRRSLIEQSLATVLGHSVVG